VSLSIQTVLDRRQKRQQELLRRRQELTDGLGLLLSQRTSQVDSDDLELAGQIQRQFLPRSFQRFGSFEVGSAVLPAGQVCGDIVDVMVFGRQWVSFWLVDATGHGLAAAMLATHLQPQLRRVSWDEKRHQPRSPEKALGLLNKLLLSRQPNEPVFVAAICGVVDLLSGRVLLSRGGTPMPMLVGPDGRVQPVLSTGRLVGIEPGNGFELVEMELARGESLVLWTDGLERLYDVECVRAEEHGRSTFDFEAVGKGRVVEALDRVRFRWWHARKNEPCDDDVSVVVLRRGA
jgi:serine phosphatase RsbU (regulator of sigma subunit)